MKKEIKRTIYGINPVSEALKAAPGDIEKIVVSRSRGAHSLEPVLKLAAGAGIIIERISKEELNRLTGTAKDQGIAALIGAPFKYHSLDELLSLSEASADKRLLLVLDSIEDPRNLGAIVRSAAAAGADGVIIARDRSARITGSAAKASAGATEHMPIAMVTNIVSAIERLKKEELWVAGLEADSPMTLFKAELTGAVAIVVGSEGKGMRRLVRESCDFIVSIPMAGGPSSLNAAQAATVALFEARRQRLHG